jgi:hypothetical protein
MQTRLIERVGTRFYLRKEWGKCPKNPSEWSNEHEARTTFDTDQTDRKAKMPPEGNPHYDEIGPCEYCGEEPPPDASNLGGYGPLYDTPSGKEEPGSLYFVEHDPDDYCWLGWENCDGKHLHAVCPNGATWVIDQRASNCGRPDDNAHRCWVRHGDPEKGEPVHVDKQGDTCTGGAGSIVAGDYHGFLHNGRFTSV